MVDTRTTELDLLASRIKAAHKSITEHTRNIVDRAIEAGDALNQGKAKFDHGQWLAWLKNNCDLPERNAQIYMQLANNKSKLKSAEAADLSTLLNSPTEQLPASVLGKPISNYRNNYRRY